MTLVSSHRFSTPPTDRQPLIVVLLLHFGKVIRQNSAIDAPIARWSYFSSPQEEGTEHKNVPRLIRLSSIHPELSYRYKYEQYLR